MLQTMKNAWKVDEIRKKIIFTFLMLIVFRLGNAIPVPFMNKEIVDQMMSGSQGGVIGLMDLLSGGSLRKMSVFALSIYPYITSSIVIQLLTIAIPRLEEIVKEGEEGKKKMGRYTKIGAIILGLVEAYALTQGFFSQAVVEKSWLSGIIIVATLLAGTMFLIWLGEAITENGIGNGISILIFLGIISGLPTELGTMIYSAQAGTVAIWKSVAVAIIAILIIFIVVAINQGERKIPVQYAKRVVGRKMYGGQATHIPVKVNMAGVMPVIFASSILQLPNTLTLFFGKNLPNWVSEYFTVNGTVGLVVYSLLNLVLVILFAYFYTAIQFNTVEYAKNLQQYGGFIPGIRPGKPTGEYLQRISNRITFIGALSLAFISSMPILLSKASGLRINFGGTAVIIVVGVVLETMKQLESMLTMRHYKGFLNK